MSIEDKRRQKEGDGSAASKQRVKPAAPWQQAPPLPINGVALTKN
jgi:hypothetical protein